MEAEAALHFRDQFREARATVLRDSEGYEAIVLVLERLGRFHQPKANGLGRFRDELRIIASESPLAHSIPGRRPDFHLDFTKLYEAVREARNLAVHEGALARHLSTHALECALVLEDALMSNMTTVGEFMVRGPTTAASWQPLSFVRQIMLMNSFSYLPVQIKGADRLEWHFVSDVSLARALRDAPTRESMLAMPLSEAVATETIKLRRAKEVSVDTTIESIIKDLDAVPLLVVSAQGSELLGIVTAFDLL